jgi:hypothetical protein
MCSASNFGESEGAMSPRYYGAPFADWRNIPDSDI